MRRRLVAATVTSLVDYGYAGTTTLRVQELAGASRGALLHHFPSKPDLFVAAVASVAEQQGEYLRSVQERPAPAGDRVRFAVSVLHEVMSGPLFLAGLELWMAARTDAALRAVLEPYEREVGRQLREIGAAAFGPEYTALPGYHLAFESLLQLLRGLATTSILRSNREVEQTLLDTWSRSFRAVCAAADQVAPSRAAQS
ncbi:TetR/AcrR family transcriptional regulator [Nocardia stercoris]|uniref:TetR/AcrR family transcriptional regulator n=1 Tax=Nocardia stercoris TaxID=2483361 RepID=A0A3M2LH73_9NOCA|nr:TetR/AcrR family transcriptional regulator [Nocardia stercoris]RMI35335.1 TetR/AcrR family transcriptional regulator [Nocardia stercoris]